MLTRKVPVGLLIALCIGVQGPALAQVYKWTDKDGNVHFGDKPMDVEAAQNAETVEIDQAYKPPERSAEELEAIQSEERSRIEAQRRRREAEQTKLAGDKAARKEARLARCSELDENIDTFGNAKMINGILHVTYIEDENGESLSAAEQREIVEGWKRERAEMGCPGA